MAQALSSIDDSEIRRRFERAIQMQAPVYRLRWEEDLYPQLLESCQEVQFFYRAAAERGFGVVRAIG